MSNNAQPLALLQQAFDALEATADSDIDEFEDEEEEAQAVPAQYACRKIAEAMDLLRAQNLASRRLEQARATARWYCIDRQGMATLCAGEDDARREVERSGQSWPRSGPHRAVQLVDLAELLRAEPPDER
jgi:hypothetical protein